MGPDPVSPEFDELVSVLSRGPSTIDDEQPSADLWDRIAAGLHEAEVTSEPEPAPGWESGSGSEPHPESEPHPGSVVSLAERRAGRGRRFAVAVAAAAAVLLVGVPVLLALRASDEPPPADEIADLAGLEGFDGSAHAELRGRDLVIDVVGLEPTDGAFYELWLLDLDDGELNDLRSLGPIAADGSFVVPEEIDVADFDVVDISLEPDDGNPDHSGASVLRGQLS